MSRLAYVNTDIPPAGLGRYLTLYNSRRAHSSLDDRTPDEAYFTPVPLAIAA